MKSPVSTSRVCLRLIFACLTLILSCVSAGGTSHAALPPARAYSLGDGTLTQTWLPRRDPNRRMPYRVEGVIAVPEGAGPFPIVFVLHDAHGGCPLDTTQPDIVTEQWPCSPAEERRSDIGLSYLLSGLASRGYVAVAPNLNAVYARAFGAVAPEGRRYADVFDAHVQALIAANAGGGAPFSTTVQGKLDLARIGMIGHGHGSLLTMQSARARAEQPRRRRASEAAQPLIGAVLVAPLYANTGDVDVPLGVLLPQCDGNTPDVGGQAYYEDARLNRNRAQLAASVFILGANSHFFNDAAGTDDAQQVADVPGCEDASLLLSRIAQHAFLTQYAADFFDAVLGNRAAAATAGMDATAPATTRLYDTPVMTAVSTPGAQRAVLTQPASQEALSTNGFGGFSAAEGAARVEFCAYRTPCGRWAVVPVNPAMARFSWTAPLGASWLLTLGDAPADLTQFATLSMRLVPDPSDALNVRRRPMAVRVSLVDERNQVASVRIDAERTPALAYPPGAPDETSFRWLGHAYLSSVRIPIAAFDGADASRVTAIKIEPANESGGSVFLADLEFIRPAAQ